MDIRRIDCYADDRFSRVALDQHGAYLVDGRPCEIRIIGAQTAVVQADDPAAYPELIEAFRFHAPHITGFLDPAGNRLRDYPPVPRFPVRLEQIQPSQFYIDERKLRAVDTFLRRAEDIVIQVLPWKNRFISLDGHTRLCWAVRHGYDRVWAVNAETDDWVWTFVREAQKRGIAQPGQMVLLPHEEYEVRWNRYCDEVFARAARDVSMQSASG